MVGGGVRQNVQCNAMRCMSGRPCGELSGSKPQHSMRKHAQGGEARTYVLRSMSPCMHVLIVSIGWLNVAAMTPEPTAPNILATDASMPYFSSPIRASIGLIPM